MMKVLTIISFEKRRKIVCKFTARLAALLILSVSLLAQQPNERPAWNVELEQNKTAPSTLTVQNRCQGTHNFRIQPQTVPFLEIGQTEIGVGGGQNKVVPVRFNTTNLQPQTYRGNVLVICLTCAGEPTCLQDRETLPVILKVTASNDSPPAGVDPADVSEKSPCDELKGRCDELSAALNRRLAEATDAQNRANAERAKADAAETGADRAEQESRMADEAAKDDPSDYKAKVDDQEYSSADTAYLEMLRNANNSALAGGRISVAEHQRRANELTAKKAREERLRNKERLKEEAREAKKKADAARKAADDAKAAADAAQSAADEAKAAAEKAEKDYQECLRKMREECDKIKAERELLEAERKKREADAKAAADAEAKLRAAEEERRKREAEVAAARRKYNEYLVDNIRQLGLIDSSAVRNVPGIWEWLPDILETPVSVLVEASAKTPIPTDTLKALGGLYGIIGKMLDPCTGLGQSKTVERLQSMTNPHTGKNYTFGEALKKTADMCKLLRNLKSKLEALRQAQQTQ
jgi:hypothetical protein